MPKFIFRKNLKSPLTEDYDFFEALGLEPFTEGQENLFSDMYNARTGKEKTEFILELIRLHQALGPKDEIEEVSIINSINDDFFGKEEAVPEKVILKLETMPLTAKVQNDIYEESVSDAEPAIDQKAELKKPLDCKKEEQQIQVKDEIHINIQTFYILAGCILTIGVWSVLATVWRIIA